MSAVCVAVLASLTAAAIVMETWPMYLAYVAAIAQPMPMLTAFATTSTIARTSLRATTMKAMQCVTISMNVAYVGAKALPMAIAIATAT